MENNKLNVNDESLLIGNDAGQLTLFGIDIEPAKDNKEKQAEKTKKKSNTAKSTMKPDSINVNLGEGWKIHYAASVFEVDVLFQDELSSGTEIVSFEDIRLKLNVEEDCAELTPSGTKWRYDLDQKQLFPDAWGQDKGAN